MKRVVGSVVLLGVASIAAFGGGLYVRGLREIHFTKPCKAIDGTHLKCDGVVIVHTPEITYSKEKPDPETLECRPKQ